MYDEGYWKNLQQDQGVDSSLYPEHKAYSTEHNTEVNGLYLASVEMHEPEAIYGRTSVTVKLQDGLNIIPNVAWPGPNVCANPSGLAGGVALGIHGLHVSPAQGQMVAVAFAGGSSNNPMVVEKYPYYADQERPDLEPLHNFPFASHAHMDQDIVLGHYTGSYIALRATIPLPGLIDILSFSAIWMDAVAMIKLDAGAAITMTAGAAVTIAAGAAMSFTSPAATTISASLGVTILSGGGPPEPSTLGTSLVGQLNTLAGLLAGHVHVPGLPPGNAALITAWGAGLAPLVLSPLTKNN